MPQGALKLQILRENRAQDLYMAQAVPSVVETLKVISSVVRTWPGWVPVGWEPREALCKHRGEKIKQPSNWTYGVQPGRRQET